MTEDAEITELQEMEKSYLAWLEERPTIREVAKNFRPWLLYYYVPSKHVVELHSFDEQKDGKITVKMRVLYKHNPNIRMERMVFGVDPNDLEPLDMEKHELPYA